MVAMRLGLRFIYPVLLVVTLWGASSLRMTPQIPGGGFEGMDKVLHFLIYGLLATALVRASGRSQHWWWGVGVVLVVSMTGMCEELIQSRNPFRSFEWYDWLADSLGALVAVCAYQWIGGYRSVLEYPLFGRFRRAGRAESPQNGDCDCCRDRELINKGRKQANCD